MIKSVLCFVLMNISESLVYYFSLDPSFSCLFGGCAVLNSFVCFFRSWFIGSGSSLFVFFSFFFLVCVIVVLFLLGSGNRPDLSL